MKRIDNDGNATDVKTAGASVNKSKHGHWSNDGVKIIDKSGIYVPFKLIQVMEALNDQFRGLEYSIFCKSKFDEVKNRYYLEEEYFIPRQIVSGASVNYKEDAPNDEFNCVIHKHPSGCMGFSGTDDTYINQNFDLSLLWVNGKFHIGQVRLKTEIGRIKLPLEIVVGKSPGIMLPVEETSKISRTQFYSAAPGVNPSNLFKGSFLEGLDEDDDFLIGGHVGEALTPEEQGFLEEAIARDKF